VRRLALPGLSAWSLDDPALHLLEVTLGADDWRGRVGLRTVAVKGRDLAVNDRPARLFGVNRHDLHPDHGSALPDDQRLSDLQLIAGLGANFVRGAHYPRTKVSWTCVMSEASRCGAKPLPGSRAPTNSPMTAGWLPPSTTSTRWWRWRPTTRPCLSGDAATKVRARIQRAGQDSSGSFAA